MVCIPGATSAIVSCKSLSSPITNTILLLGAEDETGFGLCNITRDENITAEVTITSQAGINSTNSASTGIHLYMYNNLLALMHDA